MDKPQTESTPSFFDDPNPACAFEFVKPCPSYQQNLNTPPILQNFLTCKDSYFNTSKQGFYGLHNRIIVYYADQFSSTPESILDISYSRLSALKSNQDKIAYGFVIAKNKFSFEFHFEAKEVAETWMNALKPICVLRNFHEEYKAKKMIGKGAFAKVYLVESQTTGKQFAVKAFAKDAIDKSNKANAKSTMLNEITIMRTLDHENIIKIHEVHESTNSIYLIMELVEGKSLQDPLTKMTFKKDYTEQQTIEMIRSILDALSYIASKGIMHRDLKPDNILVDKTGKIKIVDFGLATFIDESEYLFKKCGTPGYIAPEVFKYDAKNPATNYNDRCDVFSAGCILFYMLFSYAFFKGTTGAEVLQLNRDYNECEPNCLAKKDIINPLMKPSKDGLDITSKLLEFDHKKRISASQALNHPYFQPPIVNKTSPLKFAKESLHKHSRSECFNPIKMANIINSPLGSPKITSSEKGSVQAASGRRFTEKDSLYLDVGKPELNGKVETLVGGSAMHSLLVKSTSNGNGTSKTSSISAFAKQASSPEQEAKNVKGRNTIGKNKSFLKAAIFNNMQKNSDMNNNEVVKEKTKVERKLERRHTDKALVKPMKFDFDSDDISSPDSVTTEVEDKDKEDCQINKKIPNVKSGSVFKQPGKFMRASTKIVYNFQ